MQIVIARIALALGALAVSVFLALELHSEYRLQHGKAAADLSAQRGLSPAQRARVLDDLRAGQRLHPGTDALLARALVELRAGHDAEAERLAHRSIEREP